MARAKTAAPCTSHRLEANEALSPSHRPANLFRHLYSSRGSARFKSQVLHKSQKCLKAKFTVHRFMKWLEDQRFFMLYIYIYIDFCRLLSPSAGAKSPSPSLEVTGPGAPPHGPKKACCVEHRSTSCPSRPPADLHRIFQSLLVASIT